MQLERLDAWVESVVQCLVEKNVAGGHRKSLYRDSYWTLLLPATEQLPENICALLECRSRKDTLSSPDWNVLELGRTPLNGLNY